MATLPRRCSGRSSTMLEGLFHLLGSPKIAHSRATRPRDSRQEKTERCYGNFLSLPGAVGGAVAGGLAGGGVDIGDAGLLLIDSHHHIFLDYFPVGLPRHGIHRDLAEI